VPREERLLLAGRGLQVYGWLSGSNESGEQGHYQPRDQRNWACKGPLQEGPLQEGPLQEGPLQEGPLQEGPLQEGPLQEGPSPLGWLEPEQARPSLSLLP
jgi:hypothetical protein